jgi:hypothetical protein
LQGERRPQRLARRRKDRQCFITAQLDDLAAMSLHHLTRDTREPRRQARSRCVPVFQGEASIASHIRDEEGSNLR